MPDYAGRATPKGTTSPTTWSTARLRAWHLRALRTPGARSAHRTAALLALRAGRHGANVYGAQTKMAEQIKACERTVRNHVAALEDAGLISVRRTKPERDPSTGKWSRRLSNAYVLTFPPDEKPAHTYRKRLASQAPSGHTKPLAGPVQAPATVENSAPEAQTAPPARCFVEAQLKAARLALRR